MPELMMRASWLGSARLRRWAAFRPPGLAPARRCCLPRVVSPGAVTLAAVPFATVSEGPAAGPESPPAARRRPVAEQLPASVERRPVLAPERVPLQMVLIARSLVDRRAVGRGHPTAGKRIRSRAGAAWPCPPTPPPPRPAA